MSASMRITGRNGTGGEHVCSHYVRGFRDALLAGEPETEAETVSEYYG